MAKTARQAEIQGFGEKGMSEQEICPTCGKPKDQCTCELEDAIGDAREGKVDKVIVEHKFTKVSETPKGSSEGSDASKDELEATKAKLEERESQLVVMALHEAQKQKKALLDTIKDPKKKAFVDEFIGEDPDTMLDRLQQVKVTSALLGKALGVGDIQVNDGTTIPPPKGKAKSYKERGLESEFGVIDKYYDVLGDPKSTQAQRDVANKKISEMIGEFVRGSRQAGKIVSIKVLKCPKCGNVMEGNVCQNCGYEMPKWERGNAIEG